MSDSSIIKLVTVVAVTITMTVVSCHVAKSTSVAKCLDAGHTAAACEDLGESLK